MSENHPTTERVEFALRFFFAFVVAGLFVAGLMLIVWNTFLLSFNPYLCGAIWMAVTASISIWTAKTDRWGWFHTFVDWIIWW